MYFWIGLVSLISTTDKPKYFATALQNMLFASKANRLVNTCFSGQLLLYGEESLFSSEEGLITWVFSLSVKYAKLSLRLSVCVWIPAAEKLSFLI